jgi:hypothetical protein
MCGKLKLLSSLCGSIKWKSKGGNTAGLVVAIITIYYLTTYDPSLDPFQKKDNIKDSKKDGKNAKKNDDCRSILDHLSCLKIRKKKDTETTESLEPFRPNPVDEIVLQLLVLAKVRSRSFKRSSGLLRLEMAVIKVYILQKPKLYILNIQNLIISRVFFALVMCRLSLAFPF